ncbi:MAG: PPC domain-containing protein, partial [Gemmatimonadales bacterium]
CNARLTFVLPRAASYRLYANSSAPSELGAFHLRLARGKAAAPADTVCRGFGQVAGLIRVGETVTGTLTAHDPLFTGDSTYFQRWILPVPARQALTVDLESEDFDAYVLLTYGRGDKLVENDDGGGGCNARIVYTAEDDRPLRIVVNTASRPRGQTGRFTLRVTAGASPTEPKGNCRFTGGARGTGGNSASHTVAVGQARRGTLTRDDVVVTSDSTYAQAWTIQGRAGQTVTIDLESDDFDAYLFLQGPGISGGRDFQDDDAGGNCHARLTATFPETGEYEIVVNTAGAKYATGSFTLSVTSGSKPKSVQRCDRG